MKIIFLSTIVFIFISGCVSTQTIPIDPSKFSTVKPKSIIVTNREKPDFAAMTAGKAMFGLLGAAAMISEGNKIIRENSVEDPASFISFELRNELSNKYSLNIIDSNDRVNSSKLDEISSIYSNSDWILDVETINWSFGYFPKDWDNYRVIYSAKLRLIESKNKRLIAEGFCSRVPGQNDSSPSYDQLLSNKAEMIKSELQLAAAYCIKEFKTKVFNM